MIHRYTLHRLASILSLFLCFNAGATENKYELKKVISGINVPWGMVQLPDGNFLVTERSGKLFIADPKENKLALVKGVPEVDTGGQGGLLDVELHPNYTKNNYIYLSYSSDEGEGWGAHTAILRAKLQDNELTESKVLYKGSPNTQGGRHFGSRLEFDKKGYLFFSIGDRGARDEFPQDITQDAGKVYRIKDDGSIPKDNPFVGNSKAKSAIYSFGHRNPQGMALNPDTGDIWIHEHGPRGGDEVNIIGKGKNYGWPKITYGINYSGTIITKDTHQEGMEQPVHYWDPSIAPSGMTFVTSEQYPEWKGHLLVGSLKFGYLVLCKLDGNKVVDTEILFKGIGRARNVKQMDDGYIYVATEGNGIIRIELATNDKKSSDD
ncbi:PQQ-dependent sugar dehydrogenase [Pleionea sediminis]|uniref:PQQ-dependent sugar dehydrogenase n=1 Tax=Pleionea sediminis TaxID=2569479 RepID=UPI0011866BE0|nr:PQQ-dependent sugar dehydrogenase [Pleionea sediminis]